MHKLASSVAAAALLVVGTAVPADAATKTLRDPGSQQAAANNLQRARMTYAPEKAVYRLKIQRLSRARTQAIVRFYRPGYDLMITTKYVDGERRVIARRSDNDTYDSARFFKGVRARWNFKRDVIRIVNTRYLSGRSAQMDAYTVTKGWMHGPTSSPDDYVSARIRRG